VLSIGCYRERVLGQADALFVGLRVEHGLETLLVDLGCLACLAEHVALLLFAFARQEMGEAVEDGPKVIPSNDQRPGARNKAYKHRARLHCRFPRRGRQTEDVLSQNIPKTVTIIQLDESRWELSSPRVRLMWENNEESPKQITT
jgi:hypothetical protein